MDNQIKNQLLNELENLTSNMEIPFAKRKDYNWLIQNAELSNQNHKNLAKVIKISQLLKKEEVIG